MTENVINGIDLSQHLGLIRFAVKRTHWAIGASLDWEDLFQAGFFGLVRAAEKFDPAKGRFSTYALPWVRHHVQRAVSDQGRTIRLPVWYQDRERRLGRGLPATTLSLDAPARMHDSDAPSLSELLPSADEDPSAALASADRRQLIEHALTQLPERLRGILIARFWGDETLGEIGSRLSLSRERIRQLEEEGLRLLRHLLDEEQAP